MKPWQRGVMDVPGESDYLGFLRYVGGSVEEGYLDARKSAEALLGLDGALRYFVEAQAPSLTGTEYEIPVRVQKGSWEALLPSNVGQWIVTGAGIVTTAYLAKAAQKMAEKDFDGVGLTDVFRRGVSSIQWTIRLGKHMGTLAKRTFGNVVWRDANREVGIPNEQGNVLYVPSEYLELYERMPSGLLARVTSLVTVERRLEIGLKFDDHEDVEAVTADEKKIFCPETSDVLFPELEHGMEFDGEGLVTRGNENTNTLGFQYNGHILTCYPQDGSIVRFKSALFLKARMRGVVTRLDKFGEPTETKPKIIFKSVVSLEEPGSETAQQPLLFDEEG